MAAGCSYHFFDRYFTIRNYWYKLMGLVNLLPLVLLRIKGLMYYYSKILTQSLSLYIHKLILN